MKLYNTLSRSKEEFRPADGKTALIYTCGPTVYDFAHVGNLRAYVSQDLLVRALKLAGFSVRRAMNITDVGHLTSNADEGDDRMEIGAAREGKSAWDIAAFYTKVFLEDYSSLNCMTPDVVCKATEHIPEMIALVRRLEEKGYTYKTADGIYFDTSKFDGYHKLAGKSHIDGLKSGARVEFSDEKRNPSDFALWKFSPSDKKRQMEWPSPWGVGFPGWHIECSAMGMKYLGETMDIHCGGVDHVAVHHTNEIAQSEAATGKPFSRFWVHNEFLLMGSAKMAKSAGGFVTVKTLRDKGYNPLAYRYLLLGAHYRTQLEFSWDSMDFAQKSLSTMKANISGLLEACGGKIPASSALEAPALSARAAEFRDAVLDDLNTAKAVSVLWEVLRSHDLSAGDKLAFSAFADTILGLDLLKAEAAAEVPAEVLALVEERARARKEKDFKKADEIRLKAEGLGYIIKDTPKGPVCSKKA